MNSTPENPAPAASDPNVEAANHALQDAQWAEQQGLHDRAIAAYRKVTALMPGIYQVHSNLANLRWAWADTRGP
jgi:hypothetical protein